MQARKTETSENLKLRIATARQELRRVDMFDYYVINADNQLDTTVDTIASIVRAEHHRTDPRQVEL